MKFVVIGGTGLIGSKVVERLRRRGHEVVAAAPSTGINAVNGHGLDAALTGTDVVVDVANSPSFEDQAVLAFFENAGRHLAAAEQRAGVKYHVALSVVGTGRPAFAASGYIRAKAAQEALIRAAGIPYTIVQATQFFEFLGAIAGPGEPRRALRISSGLMQPIAAEDVAAAVTDCALGAAINGTVEIGGPQQAPMAQWVQRFLAATGDSRTVVADPQEPYFGAVLEAGTLLPGEGAMLGRQDFDTWFARWARDRRGAAA